MIHLKNGSAEYSINPFRGAATCHWSISGRDILYIDPNSYFQPQVKFKGGNPVMFPIFSTLNLDGSTETSFHGKEINLPQHGSARLSNSWRVNMTSDSSAILYLQHTDESLKDYPFKFNLEVHYQLREDSLELTQKVYNPGNETMAFVAGFHPYFKVSDPSQCEVSGLVPGTQCYDLPNAGPFNFNAHLPHSLPLGKREINHHMVTGARKITLKDRLTTKRISINPSAAYPCLTVWSEPGEPFVCIEPTSGRRGAFETRENLTHLAPGKSWEGKVEFKVENLP